MPCCRPMTFQQCVSYHLVREELAYDVAVDAGGSVAVGRVPVGPREYTCPCKQCFGAPIGPFQAPQQPRWAADTNLLCYYYDSWRRMEQTKPGRVAGHPKSARGRRTLIKDMSDTCRERARAICSRTLLSSGHGFCRTSSRTATASSVVCMESWPIMYACVRVCACACVRRLWRRATHSLLHQDGMEAPSWARCEPLKANER